MRNTLIPTDLEDRSFNCKTPSSAQRKQPEEIPAVDSAWSELGLGHLMRGGLWRWLERCVDARGWLEVVKQRSVSILHPYTVEVYVAADGSEACISLKPRRGLFVPKTEP
jgi:hypothetical protein